MRRRLVLAFVLLVVAIVVLYGVPRAFVLAENVEDAAEDQVARGADVSAAIVEQAQQDGRPVTSELLEPVVREGERVELQSQDGEPLVLPAGSDLGDDDVVATRELADGSTLTYSLSDELVSADAREAILPLLLLGLALIPLGALVGAWLARRLARPFSELAVTARDMGAGELRPEVARYGVPEADEIATALQDSGRQLDLMLQRERDVAVNASHELRTPITALRLAMEDVALWPETAPEVAAEMNRLIGEVDRLAAAVTTLLDARRRWSTPADR